MKTYGGLHILFVIHRALDVKLLRWLLHPQARIHLSEAQWMFRDPGSSNISGLHAFWGRGVPGLTRLQAATLRCLRSAWPAYAEASRETTTPMQKQTTPMHPFTRKPKATCPANPMSVSAPCSSRLLCLGLQVVMRWSRAYPSFQLVVTCTCVSLCAHAQCPARCPARGRMVGTSNPMPC